MNTPKATTTAETNIETSVVKITYLKPSNEADTSIAEYLDPFTDCQVVTGLLLDGTLII